MAKYALLGGRSVKYLEDFSLEEKIFNFLGLSNPQILFVPMASYKNYEASIEKFRRLTKKSNCRILYLHTLNDPNLEDFIMASDVIYFGGGCAEELVKSIKNSPLLELLRKYESTNKVYMGISAGAIMLSSFGMGDRYAYVTGNQTYNYQMVEGLHFLNITVCPHYNHQGLECYNEVVRNYSWDGYALEDDTAIVIDKNVKIFKRDSKMSVYRFDSNNAYLMESLYEV